MPFIQLIFPFILMGTLYSFQENFGPWNARNYILYLFIGYTILLTQRVVSTLSSQLSTEKVWQTLEAIMMAPIKRINIL